MKVLLLSIPLVGMIAWAVSSHTAARRSPVVESGVTKNASPKPQTLQELLTLSETDRDSCDLELANLRCAEGLPGAGGPDLDSSLATLDDWARKVRSETDRHLYRFQSRPDEYENSEGYFRMLMMAVVLHAGEK